MSLSDGFDELIRAGDPWIFSWRPRNREVGEHSIASGNDVTFTDCELERSTIFDR